MPIRFALSSIAAPSAMSDVDSPRCHSRIVSLSLSRPGFAAGDDFAQLRMERRRRQLACIDVRAEAAELTGPALAPVVDDDLVHDVGERKLDGAHRAVGYDERAAARSTPS